MKASPRARLCKKISRRMRRTEAIQRSAAHFIKMSRRGRVYAKNIGANAANGSDSAFAGGRFIKMNRRGRLCKKNIAANAENGIDSAFRRAFY